MDNQNQVTIYTKDNCPYCTHAKNFFKENNINYKEVHQSANPEEVDRLKNETGWRTLPMIMINGDMIGGYSDMKELHQAGKLMPLINK